MQELMLFSPFNFIIILAAAFSSSLSSVPPFSHGVIQ